MFNPKTLLQCLSKDVLGFVPPPIQFRDDTSPMHDAFGSPADTELEENDEECPERIFEKKAHAVSTPRKENETWIFSRDNNYDLQQPCTVTRINSQAAPHNGPQNNVKVKLSKFSYKGKNKLKI